MQDISLLKEALPFLRRFKGAKFVIKFGGEAMRSREALQQLAQDISFLYSVGIQVVIVHGGGAQVTELEQKLGVDSKKVAGRRITSEESLESLKMVLAGKMNVDLVAALQGAGVRAMGFSAMSAGLIVAEKREPMKVTGGGDEAIDFGQVGNVKSVNTQILNDILNAGVLPVISPLSADASGNILNINADTIASSIASDLKADKFLLMIDKLGVMTDMNDPTSLISELDFKQAREAISQGIISGGMIPKVEEALKSLENGVGQVHILSAVEPHQLLLEIFTESGCGTMLVQD